MSCVTEYEVCLTRGSTYKLDVGLSAGFTDVIESPEDWQGHMVFREAQDDSLTNYFTDISAVDVIEDPLPGEPPAYFRFRLETADTQSLPYWDHVHYIDLVFVGPAVGGTAEVRRLVQGPVRVGD